MINLLAPEEKREIQAARTNILLVRYILLLVIAAAFLAASLGVALYYLQTIRANAETTISQNTEKEGTYKNVKSRAESFQNTITNSKAVLDGQIDYSKVILNISRRMPNGSALESLKLDKSSFSSPLSLSVKLKGEEAAQRLLSNFKSAPFVTNVTKGAISLSSDKSYPYSMQLNITLNKEAAQR